ncbi:CARDB domain-containing protein [Nanoarchaeota archaeon]
MKVYNLILALALLLFMSGCYEDAYVGGLVDINGSISSVNFENYTMDYGLGENPTTWTSEAVTLVNDGQSAVADGLIATIDTKDLEKDLYTVRLTINDINGGATYDYLYLNIENLVIYTPYDNQFIVSDEIFNITGTAYAGNFTDYDIQYRPVSSGVWSSSGINLTNDGTQTMTNGLLATWNNTGLSDGLYELKLIVNTDMGPLITSSNVNIISPDPYEYDNDYENATYIAIGETQTHTIAPLNDADYFKFDADTEENYEIESSNILNYLNPEITVYDTDGVTELDSDLDRLLFEPSVSGTYYIGIRETFEDFGGYDITITNVTKFIDIEAESLSLWAGNGLVVNETMELVLWFENLGTISAENTTASFYEYDEDLQDYVLFNSSTINLIEPGVNQGRIVDWTPSRTGIFELKGVIYHEDDIDNSNDVVYRTYNILGPGPDLDLTDLDIVGSTIINQKSTIRMEFDNDGNGKAENITAGYYDLYDYEEGSSDYAVEREFSYGGIDYTVNVDKIEDDISNVTINYNDIEEQFLVYDIEARTLQSGMFIYMDVYPSSYHFVYGTAEFNSTTVDELDAGDYMTLDFDWIPTVEGFHAIIGKISVENEVYPGDNIDVVEATVTSPGANLDVYTYLVDTPLIEVTQADYLSNKVSELEIKDLGNGTMSIYAITTNQSYNLYVTISNNGNEAANNVVTDVYFMHNLEYEYGSFDENAIRQYNGTEYEFLGHKMDNNTMTLNVSYGGTTEEYELKDGQSVILGNGVILELRDIVGKYDDYWFRLGQGTHSSDIKDSIHSLGAYSKTFEWEPEAVGEHLITVFTDTANEVDYSDNSESRHVEVGGFGVDVKVDWINYEYPVLVNESNPIRIYIDNVGSEYASNINVSLYDETNGHIIGWAVMDLEVDKSTNFQIEWTPNSTGEYQLKVVADVEGEVNPGNNEIIEYVDVRIPGPDLDLYIYDIPNGLTGQETEITFRVWNEGSEDATNVVANLFVDNVFISSQNMEDILSGHEDIIGTFKWTPTKYGTQKVNISVDTPGETRPKDNWDTEYVYVTVKKPIVTILNPENGSTIHSSSAWLNVTTDDVANCSYKRIWNGIGDASAIAFPQREATEHLVLMEGLEQYDYLTSVACRNVYGGSEVANVEFTVDFSNYPPEITSFSPTEESIKITEDGQISFNVAASDSEWDTLTFNWFVNDNFVWTGNSYNLIATGAGEYNVSVVVSDGELNTSNEWTISAYDHPLAETFDGSTSDFSSMTELELANAIDVVLEKTAYGKIEFDNALDLTDTIDLDSCVVINDGLAGIDNSCVPELNKPATITLYHRSYDKLPTIFYSEGFTTSAAGVNTVCDFCTLVNYTDFPTSDGIITFTVDHFTVFTTSGTNLAPIANAGADQNGELGILATLDGSNSYDPDGDPITYAWTQTSGPNVNLSNTNSVNPSFTPSEKADYVFQLTVNDSIVTSSDSVSVKVGDKLVIKDLDVEVDGKSDNVNNGDTISKEAKPGSTVEFKIEVENTFTESMDIEDIEVEVIIYDIDDGSDLDDEADEFKLRDGRDDQVTMEFEIPMMVDEDKYTVEINVKGEDEDGDDHEVQWIVYLEVEKERHEILIDELYLSPTTIKCDRNPRLNVEIINLGSKDEDDVVIDIESPSLGIDLEDEGIELDEGSDEDSKYDRIYRFNIDDDVNPGTYPIKVTVYRDEDEEEASESVNLMVQSCKEIVEAQDDVTVETNVVPVPQTTLPPYVMTPDSKTEVSFRDSDEYMMLLVIFSVVLLGAVIYGAGAVVILSRK